MRKQNYKSLCCDAPVSVMSGSESVSNWYRCTSCNKPCDARIVQKPKVKIKLSKLEKTYIRHALSHLLCNKICDTDDAEGWYSGNKDAFIKRHKATINFLQKLLSQ